MALKDPTAWVQDLSFYMSDEELADTIEAQEPLLLPGSSKVAAALWVAVVGVLGGAFGAVTVSPAIRRPLTFALYLIVAALLLRALHPLIVRVRGSAVAWLAMFAFFWTSLLGLLVVVGARLDSRWLGYGVSVGGGAFVGMMYGSFRFAVLLQGLSPACEAGAPPAATRWRDPAQRVLGQHCTDGASLLHRPWRTAIFVTGCSCGAVEQPSPSSPQPSIQALAGIRWCCG